MIREDLRAVGKPPGAELPKAIRKLEIGEGRMVEARDLHGDGLCLSRPSEIGGELSHLQLLRRDLLHSSLMEAVQENLIQQYMDFPGVSTWYDYN